MALEQPVFKDGGSFSFQTLRYLLAALGVGEGVATENDLKVSQRSAGANMSVDVAAGAVWVQGDSTAREGFYLVVNDAAANVAVASNVSGNPRIDRVVIPTDGGGAPLVVQGVPTAGASLADPLGVAAEPASQLTVALLEVVNGAASIPDAKISDQREVSSLTGGNMKPDYIWRPDVATVQDIASTTFDAASVIDDTDAAPTEVTISEGGLYKVEYAIAHEALTNWGWSSVELIAIPGETMLHKLGTWYPPQPGSAVDEQPASGGAVDVYTSTASSTYPPRQRPLPPMETVCTLAAGARVGVRIRGSNASRRVLRRNCYMLFYRIGD